MIAADEVINYFKLQVCLFKLFGPIRKRFVYKVVSGEKKGRVIFRSRRPSAQSCWERDVGGKWLLGSARTFLFDWFAEHSNRRRVSRAPFISFHFCFCRIPFTVSARFLYLRWVVMRRAASRAQLRNDLVSMFKAILQIYNNKFYIFQSV